ncbi:SusC/RagA family TonB-linked outer membrane protein [Mucilaginibacter sp. PAMB04274]|uniref:SusC/RagA family TonB-linked outer membrane protein n=1 Tax=Mucilaginibacter sp. PAMB04274 TaxID=3138568 RepID=UPI0031F65F3D
MKKKNIKACCVLFAALLVSMAKAQGQEKNDSLVNVAFRTVAKEDLLGAVSTVNVSELLKKSYGTNSLDNLQSFVGGYTGNIWGQAPLILVDGVPRRTSDVRLVEIQSITVLKGASAVVLYGSSAAKGAILITTKRGSIGPLRIDVRGNAGLFVPKAYPKYLDAANYMTLYNEALTNDGIATAGAGYSQDDINNTRAGNNPFRYPDIDFFSSDYLKKTYYRSDVTTEVSGGNEFARYYTNIGLTSNNSLVNYGEQKKNKDFAFNVRGNVDMNLSKWLTASVNAVANLNDNYAGRGDFWGASSTITPNFNRFSPLIPISLLDPNNAALQTIVKNSNHIIDGQYLLGGQSTNPTNVFSDMLAAGYIKTRSRSFLYNLNARADLGSLIKGLSFSTGTSMDYTSLYSEAYQLPYATYRPTWSTVNGRDIITALERFGEDRNSTSEFVGRSTYTQTMSFRSQFDYGRTFAQDHNVTATLLGWWYKTQFSSDIDNEGGSDYQPVKNTNLGFQAGYNYRRKYYLDFSGALVHSAKLPPGKRDALSPTITLGWRISDENFLKNKVSFLDNLKITSSYASINQDLDITGYRANNTAEPVDHYLYQGYYSNTATFGGYYQWRDNVAGGRTTLSGQAANPDLTFVKRNEFRVGLDGSLFKNLITLDVNYFSQTTDGLLARGLTIYPSYFSGSGDFRPWINFNKEKRSGVDFAVNLNKKIGQVQYSLGVTGMFYNSKILRRDETPAESYLARTGGPLDANYGYVSEGFFQSQAEIDSYARQTFGTVKPGDIKYKDINGDGLIDSRDQTDLGHTGFAASPFNYGLNLTVKWKRLTLFALGSGNVGSVAFKNSSYYWAGGTSKYSEVVLGRWTEANKNSATYPRLTTNSTNNFRNSTFWMYKTNRFNLNRVQFTYDFNEEIFKKSFVHGLSVYVQGDNLLVLSKERELMETNIGSAPQTRFFNLGVRTSF